MDEKKPFAYQAAAFSLYAPLVCIILNLMIKQNPLAFIVAVASVLCYAAGLILGIYALISMKTHGKEYILPRAVIGSLLNIFIIFAGVVTFSTLHQIHEEEMARLNAEIVPFSFTPPSGFEEFSAGTKTPGIIESYINGSPNDTIPDIYIFVEDLEGIIGNESLAEFMKGRNLQISKATWKEFSIDVIEIPEKMGIKDFLTYNAQVPTLPTAIQIKVFGPAELKSDLKRVVQFALDGVEGSTNWEKP